MNDLSPVRSELIEGGAICRLVLNQPKANILDAEMVRALTEAINEYGGSDTLRAFLITAEGPHFSFGASIEEHLPENVADMLSTFHDLFRALIQANRVTVCSVRGQCLGGGLELAAFCHRLFAAPDASLGQPEINLAVFAPVASLVLSERMGRGAADDMLLSGRALSAEDALVKGLVDEVADDPDAAALEYLQEHFVKKSGAALRFANIAARAPFHNLFMHAIEGLEKFYLEELMKHPDATEGLNAFLEKRRPVWQEGEAE